MNSGYYSKVGNSILRNYQEGDVMNLSKMTDQQLYKIAMNESNRMKDRYEAAKELQERRKKR